MNINRNLKKQLVQTTVIAASLIAMSGCAVTSHQAYEKQIASVVTSENATSGIVSALGSMQLAAVNTAASVDASGISVVAAGQSNENVQPVDEWSNRLMANVNEYLYVRVAADENSAIVGKLRKGDVANIVSTSNEWTQITSGNVNGYVSNAFVVTGNDARELASQVCQTEATSTTSGLRVRSAADENASILTVAYQGAVLSVDTARPAADGWTSVAYDGESGYVKSDFITVAVNYGTGITVEEEQAAIEAQKAKEAAEAAKSAQTKVTTRSQNAAVAANYDDVTLLAALIQCEAGNESYEGQLAVGAVVVNRLHSGFAGSIYGVIYQSGQFSPAGSGKVAAAAASGPSGTAVQAAQEALGGTDNTSGATSFKRASSRQAGPVIGNHVFF